jgi:hypothetical protein
VEVDVEMRVLGDAGHPARSGAPPLGRLLTLPEPARFQYNHLPESVNSANQAGTATTARRSLR